MGIATDKAFPRGGFVRKEKSEDTITTVKSSKPKKERDLFSTEIIQDGKQKKKKNKNKKGDKKNQEFDDSLRVKTVEPLTYDKLTEGFKTLARISEIGDLDLKLSLPGRLVAWIPILQISSTYTDALKKVAENPEKAENLGIRPLKEMFKEGQLVSSSITKVEKDSENGFYKVTATLNPTFVNDNNTIEQGNIVMASVKSVEDHGFIMDVGKSHLKAFLPLKKIKKGEVPPSLGQVVACYVTKNDGNAVVLNASKVDVTVNDMNTLNIHQMYPGMNIEAKFQSNLKNGLELKFADFTGYVNVSHLNDEIGEIGQSVKATILYILPTVNHIHMSLQENLTFGAKSSIACPTDQHKIGDLVKDCSVLEIDQRGLVINLGKCKAFFSTYFEVLKNCHFPVCYVKISKI